MNWNCAAIYSNEWKDALVKGEEPILRTPKFLQFVEKGEDDDTGAEKIHLHSSDSRLLCIVNSWATVVGDWIPPDGAMDMYSHLKEFMYPDVQIGWNEEVDECFGMESEKKKEDKDETMNGVAIANRTCLVKVAEKHCYLPSII